MGGPQSPTAAYPACFPTTWFWRGLLFSRPRDSLSPQQAGCGGGPRPFLPGVLRSDFCGPKIFRGMALSSRLIPFESISAAHCIPDGNRCFSTRQRLSILLTLASMSLFILGTADGCALCGGTEFFSFELCRLACRWLRGSPSSYCDCAFVGQGKVCVI